MSDAAISVIGRSEQVPTTFSHAEILRVILGVMVCIFLAALDQTVVIPALPAIASDLGSYQQLSWIVAAYLITSTISTPIYGKLSDIYGRRRVLITCIAIFIATSTLCGAAQSLNQLIWFRALQGLGGGGLMAMTQAAIADVVSPRERGRYQGYISAVWAITAVSGPIVGGFLAQHLSWRWIFWINLPVGAAAMWACHNALRRLSPPALYGRPKLDIIGMLLLSGAITVLLLALGWGGSAYSWLSYEILGLAGGGLCLLLLLAVQELRVHDPLLPPRVFQSPSYVASLTVSTLASLLMFICLFTIPLYFQFVRGSTAAQSGLYLVPFMLASAAGNVAGSRWARHFGTLRGGLRIATALSCAGLMLLALLPLGSPIWATIAGMIVTGFGVGICFIGSITSAQNALITGDIGSGTSALLVLRAVGGASGSTLAGTMIASGMIAIKHTAGDATLSSTFGMVYAAAAMIAAIAFVMTLRMPNTRLRETLHIAPASE
ncbi:MAG TPA: MFS transporter [Acetobacteraceae bacterium]|nr:MFS transporter [Acetobacteraceae bacterium]